MKKMNLKQMEHLQGGGWAGCAGGLVLCLCAGAVSVGTGFLGSMGMVGAGLVAYDACTEWVDSWGE